MKFFTLLVSTLITVSCASKAIDPNQVAATQNLPAIIKLTSTDNTVTDVSIHEFETRVALSELTISNPAYKGLKKSYEGFDFIKIVKVIDPDLIASKKPFWIQVTTLDGWTAPVYESKTLIAGKALLAIRELPATLTQPVSQDGKWSIVVTPKKEFNPGPFYLIWNDAGKNPDVMPFQVASIKVLATKPAVEKK